MKAFSFWHRVVGRLDQDSQNGGFEARFWKRPVDLPDQTSRLIEGRRFSVVEFEASVLAS
jgi:hypothetical protein